MLIALVKIIVLIIGMEMVATASNIVIPGQPRTERIFYPITAGYEQSISEMDCSIDQKPDKFRSRGSR